MREKFIDKNFNGSSLVLIEQAVNIINEMAEQGYTLTLRQLYYQFVTKNWLENIDKNYKRLGSIINDARLAGIIDWNSIIDRTRYLRKIPDYRDPVHFLHEVVPNYAHDILKDQDNYMEVWIEKDALIGVIERPCDEWRVPYYSCRGYGSQSEMYEAGKRLGREAQKHSTVTVLVLTDHDPSGLNMNEDMQKRLDMYCGEGLINVQRVALTMAQIEEHDPPPNPAKETDSRFAGYAEQFGDESWELDSLAPAVIHELVNDAIETLIDVEAFNNSVERETLQRGRLDLVSQHFNALHEFARVGNRVIE